MRDAVAASPALAANRLPVDILDTVLNNSRVMIMQKTAILFPIENLTRELDFRLLLAVLAVNPRRRIYVGHPWALGRLYDKIRGGVYVGKTFLDPSTPETNLDGYNWLKSRHLSIVLLEEEGGFFPGDEDDWRRYLSHRLDPTILGSDDFLLTWGEFQAEHYRGQNEALDGQIYATGHPRFDLYKPKYRAFFDDPVRQLREEFGRFILVNTSSGLGNHSRGDEFVFSTIAERGAAAPEWKRDRIELWSEQKMQLANFVRIGHQLSREFPDATVVFRPHPSEDQQYYRRAFEGLSNIVVRREGPVAPWIFASELVLQEGCTTAVEAFLADKPLISFNSVAHPTQEQKVLKLFGIQCDTPESVSDAVGDIFAGHRGVEHRMNDDARMLFANFESEAIEPVLEIIDKAESTIDVDRQSPSVPEILPREYLEVVKAEFKKPLRRAFPERQRVHESLRGQFAGFERDAVAKKVATLEKMWEKQVRYSLLSPWLMVFEAGES